MVKVQWKGMAEAIGKLSGKGVEEAISAALKNNAEEIKRNAIAKAPKDTGFLKSNINTSYPANTKAEIKSAATYSGYLEYGTRKMKNGPYPFMRPALEQQQSKMQKDFRDAIRKGFGG